MAKNIDTAFLVGQVAQMHYNNVSATEIKQTLLNLCQAEGMDTEEALQRVNEAFQIWSAIPTAAAAANTPERTRLEDTTNSPTPEQPPSWLAPLLAALIPQEDRTTRRRRQPDPEMFDGTRSKFPIFIQQLTAKIENDQEDFSNEKAACDYAFGRLKDSAAQLMLPYMRSLRADNSYDFNKLLTFFHQMFGDPHQEERARDRVMSMRQGNKSIRKYIMEFQEQLMLSHSGLNEQMKMTIFRNGLHPKLQDKLIGIDCPTQDDLQSQAVKISDQLYRMDLHIKRSKSSNYLDKSTTSKKTHGSFRTSNEEDTMEGVEYTGKTYLSRNEYTKLSKEGRCFRCKRRGHRSYNCPEISDSENESRKSKEKSWKKKKLSKVASTSSRKKSLVEDLSERETLQGYTSSEEDEEELGKE